MLTIRRAQIEHLEQAAMNDFRHRLHRRLSELISSSGSQRTAGQIWHDVDAALHMRIDFHLHREVDIARFAELFCLYFGQVAGASLATEALAILYEYGTDPEEKLTRLANSLAGTKDGTHRGGDLQEK